MNTVKHKLRFELSPKLRGKGCRDDGPVMIRRGDDLSHELIVSLRNDREPYVITDDVRVYLYAVSADNDRYLEECTVKDNEISILLKASMLDSSDTVLELRLVGAGGEMLASPALRVISVGNEAYETAGREFAENEDYSALLRALRRAEDVAIASVDVENGDLLVTYGDSERHNAGRVTGEKGDPGADGKDGYTPVKGIDYYTPEDKLELEAYISAELAKRGQLKPEFAESIAECTDSTKLYVLPDGYIYAYMHSTSVQQIRDQVDTGYDYPEDSRLASDGTVVTSGTYAGYTVTPFVDLLKYPTPFTLHLDGAAFLVPTVDSYTRVYTYNESKTKMGGGSIIFTEYDNFLNVSDGDVVRNGDGSGSVTFYNVPKAKDGSAVRYLRNSAKLFGTPSVYVTYTTEVNGYQWTNTGISFVGGTVDADIEAAVSRLNNEGGSPAVFSLLPPAVQAFYGSAPYSDSDYSYTNIVRGTLPYRGDVPLPVTLKWEHNEDAMRTVISVNTASTVLSSGVKQYDATGCDNFPVYNLIPDTVYYYTVVHLMADGTAVTAKNGTFRTGGEPWRLLKVSGISNVRDLGGLTGFGGKRVKYGKLFRGCAMDDSTYRDLLITDEGKREMIVDLGIKAELDLRYGYTKSAVSDDLAYVCLSYPSYAAAFTDAGNRTRFKECLEWIVARLSESEAKPVYFHCQGGCDRTGTLAFQLLGLLGVGESDLAREYELSSFSPIGRWDRIRNSTVYGYSAMTEALKSYAGDTLTEKFVNFAVACGVTYDTVECFRSLMLE